MTYTQLVFWSAAILIYAFILSYAGAVVFAAVKTFILNPRDAIRYREHTRRLLEAKQLKKALENDQGHTSRILWHAVEKAGGEISIDWEDILDDGTHRPMSYRVRSGRAVTFTTSES